MNGLQEVQNSRPVTFSCGAGQRRRCTGQNLAQWNNGGPDSERYHQRPTRLPAEDCGFHPQSFEEAGGCRRCLHWILSYGSIFRFIEGTCENYFCYLCIGNIEVTAISQCLLTSHPPCIRSRSFSNCFGRSLEDFGKSRNEFRVAGRRTENLVPKLSESKAELSIQKTNSLQSLWGSHLKY